MNYNHILSNVRHELLKLQVMEEYQSTSTPARNINIQTLSMWIFHINCNKIAIIPTIKHLPLPSEIIHPKKCYLESNINDQTID